MTDRKPHRLGLATDHRALRLDPTTVDGRASWALVKEASRGEAEQRIDGLSAALLDKLASVGAHLSGWQPIDTAPKDRPILGWGEVRPSNEMDQITPRGPRRAVIYWDTIDEAWCVNSHPWNGPFFEPTLWTELPDLPEGATT